jgi:hypothetical protein
MVAVIEDDPDVGLIVTVAPEQDIETAVALAQLKYTEPVVFALLLSSVPLALQST